ncbi:MAG: ABC transporter ATP-binding protein, partial [Rhodospirillaceae bacterium]|nr:ABC transporter ATP-binding protein [Rhodospirillaceae bacterium]
MTTTTNDTQGTQHPPGRGRPPRAYVGSQISLDEEMFGALFDGGVVRRFLAYVRPYRKQVWLAIAAVLVVTAAQLAIPLIIRFGIDNVLLADGGNAAGLFWVVMVFAAVITVNYGANWLQDRLIGVTGEHVIFDLRQAMYA